MKHSAQHITSRTVRLGSPDPADRIRQSMANVRLEGLNPNPKTAAIVQAMAEGSLAPEAAIRQICSWYVRRA